ncbi:hypothetical protein DSM104299_00484 [Baekduia alba]|nr:hypothetical protein DSM104299_00484 [Baekduia alba]
MRLQGLTVEDDYLLHQVPDSFVTAVSSNPRWFERLYFNIHDPDGTFLVVTGFGVFPNAQVADGYVVVEDQNAQRNVRLARDLAGRRTATEVGPLRFTMVEPMRRWRLQLDETERVAFDVTFEARSVPYSVGLIEFPQQNGPDTAFRHYNQAGTYSGQLVIDGVEHAVEGCLGQRDHSWGLRQPRERLGLHFWICAHFDDHTLMASYNESREHEVSFCEGAILYADERDPVRVVDLKHDMDVTPNGLQASETRLRFVLEDGRTIETVARPTLPGLLMSGGGHGGWHGQHRGDLHVESERWEHGTRDISKEPIGIVDQLARFETDGATGIGVVEFGISRSRSYTYKARW